MKVYSGRGIGRFPVGECENGRIYYGIGSQPKVIGEYANGIIYSDFGFRRKAVGEYKNGGIYQGTGYLADCIGEYEKGIIYHKTGVFRNAVGEYDGDACCAAAYLLLLSGGTYLNYNGPKTHSGVSNSAASSSRASSSDSTASAVPAGKGDNISPIMGFVIFGVLVALLFLTKAYFPVAVGVINLFFTLLFLLIKLIRHRCSYHPRFKDIFFPILAALLAAGLSVLAWGFIMMLIDGFGFGVGFSDEGKRIYEACIIPGSILNGMACLVAMFSLSLETAPRPKKQKHRSASHCKTSSNYTYATNAANNHAFVVCECGARLRYRSDLGKLIITCPRCGRKRRVN